ncbi:thyroid receptor-interacting protein 6-like isoform X2 [Brevipalpus obovatus]|uniref:thyroid receptor-interacting protein 6-like isoform X2 n=1 Tax=Brevipalpus obovatus TaxID=246614 RepID=UPI003D9ECA90
MSLRTFSGDHHRSSRSLGPSTSSRHHHHHQHHQHHHHQHPSSVIETNRSYQTSRWRNPLIDDQQLLAGLLDGMGESEPIGMFLRTSFHFFSAQAMGSLYHIRCFTCHVCHRLLQGTSFYNRDDKPYCEADYLNTLEKCCVCNRPIRDRILRATGKPYHSECFTCTVCGKGLEGIPFTVDSANRIHCIEDFNIKFAPRCCVCRMPIISEPNQPEPVRIVALDRSFHVRCYSCEDCGLLLSSQAGGERCYPLDDHILCRDCNARRVRQLTA